MHILRIVVLFEICGGQFERRTEYPQVMTEESQGNTDHEAFLRLFAKFEGNLRALVASLLPTWDGVDEVMQETSVVLWRKFGQFDQRSQQSSFLDWSFMIARYEVLKYRRRRATDRLRFSDEVFELLASEAENVVAVQGDRGRALEECMRKLETRQTELLKAVYEDGVSIKDVATRLGRTPTGLYKALARIRNRLAICIRTKLGEVATEGLQ